jgi:NADP-dependent 3-hydroxy acid dehydrogenase YdfG
LASSSASARRLAPVTILDNLPYSPSACTTIISPGVVATELGNDITDADLASALTTWRQKSLTPDAIARAIRYALEQPEGVDINEIIVRPTAAGM